MAFNHYLHNLPDLHVIGKIIKLQWEKNPANHVSHVTCCLSCVTCHLSLAPTATATDCHCANSSIMHSRLVWNTKKENKVSNATTRGMPILATWPEVSSPLGSRVSAMAHTNKHKNDSWTLPLKYWMGPVGPFSKTWVSGNSWNPLFTTLW